MNDKLKKEMHESLSDLEKKIGYSFKDINKLILALTHSSYANEFKEAKLSSNERLEFLGDAVLNIVISEAIYKLHSELNEGDMTKARSIIVCEHSLLGCSNAIEISKHLLLGKGEELTGGRQRHSILADAFEAIIGAIYIDGGINSAREFIKNNMNSIIQDAIKGHTYDDYKTLLQELIQKTSECAISYELLEEKGPDHDKTFVTQVIINTEIMGKGKGKTKKESEQLAAFTALEKLKD